MALPSPTASPLPDMLEALNKTFSSLSSLTAKLPGSAIAWRYFKASHQDDPFRTVLEILLVFFIVRTYAQSRTKGDASGRNFVKLSEKVSARELCTAGAAELPLLAYGGASARLCCCHLVACASR